MIRIYKALLGMLVLGCFVLPPVHADGVDVKNFLLVPEIQTADFEDDSVTIVNGNMTSGFLSMTASAASSRILEEDGSRYLLFEDAADDATAASLVVKPPGDSVYERFIFSFDIRMPNMYAGRTHPDTGKAVAAIGLNFNSVDDTLASTGRPIYFTFSRHATENKWIYQVVDTTSSLLGNAGLSFGQWYAVRYEVNLKTHLYNIYMHERDTGALVAKYIGRPLRDRSNSGETFAIDKYYINNITLSVNAQNTGGAVNVSLDNIAFAKEAFHIPGQPEITVSDTGVITARASVKNETLTSMQSPVLVLTLYGKNDRLTDVEYASVAVGAKAAGSAAKPQEALLSCSLNKPLLGSGYSARAMLLTSFGDRKAYFPEVSVSLD